MSRTDAEAHKGFSIALYSQDGWWSLPIHLPTLVRIRRDFNQCAPVARSAASGATRQP